MRKLHISECVLPAPVEKRMVTIYEKLRAPQLTLVELVSFVHWRSLCLCHRFNMLARTIVPGNLFLTTVIPFVLEKRFMMMISLIRVK